MSSFSDRLKIQKINFWSLIKSYVSTVQLWCTFRDKVKMNYLSVITCHKDVNFVVTCISSPASYPTTKSQIFKTFNHPKRYYGVIQKNQFNEWLGKAFKQIPVSETSGGGRVSRWCFYNDYEAIDFSLRSCLENTFFQPLCSLAVCRIKVNFWKKKKFKQSNRKEKNVFELNLKLVFV